MCISVLWCLAEGLPLVQIKKAGTKKTRAAEAVVPLLHHRFFLPVGVGQLGGTIKNAHMRIEPMQMKRSAQGFLEVGTSPMKHNRQNGMGCIKRKNNAFPWHSK